YRDPTHWQSLIRQDKRLARRVNRRLERSEESARRMINRHRIQLDMIAAALKAYGTLEGPELAELVERGRAAVTCRTGTGVACLHVTEAVLGLTETHRPLSIRTNASRHCITTIVRSCGLYPVGCVSVPHRRHLS